MKSHFQQLAHYNIWANGKLYDAVQQLDEENRNKDIGAFFGSVIGTLNHILVGDLAWMSRIDNQGPVPTRLDEILHTDFSALRTARAEADQRLLEIVENVAEDSLSSLLTYKTVAGEPQETLLSDVLTHIFNHQTHHRGQCHQSLSQLGSNPPSIDLIYYLREQK